MEKVNKDEIYYVEQGNFWMIGLVINPDNEESDSESCRGDATFINSNKRFNINSCWCYHTLNRTNRLASEEEQHWLRECIRLNKYIEKDEAMKTFIPEYVECINTQDNSWKFGKIYKVNKDRSFNFESGKLCIYDNYYTNTIFFKPSTKEVYDAQFVVKEPEFVLPEKWFILRTYENYKTINKWFRDNGYGHPSAHNTVIAISENKRNYVSPYNNNTVENHTKITFEQFKKYVLKEETIENQFISFDDCVKAKETIKPLPQFKVIETIETITKVENNEGSQFFIGDTVTPIEGNNKGVKFTIESFRYNNIKTSVCAITNKHKGKGININNIEHYIEPKVIKEEVLLEKAKILYPIGTKFKSPNSGNIFTVKDHSQEEYENFKYKYLRTVLFNTNEANANGHFYAVIHSHDGKWAEIIK
jgi:hypothetical protein